MSSSIYSSISFPVVFKQKYGGNKLKDILNTGWPNLYLISDRMKNVLMENNLTGWKTFPVSVFDKKGQEITGYHGLSVTGRCGKIDDSKAEMLEKQFAPNAPFTTYYKGLHIGLDKWDGQDFFLPEEYYGIIVTKRVVEVLKKNKINSIFENLSDIELHHLSVQITRDRQSKNQ